MARAWQLQEAKNRFSEVVDAALAEEPQVITRRGKEIAIVLSYDQYRALVVGQQKLSEFFAQSPLADLDIDLTRDRSPVRDRIDV